MWYCQMSLWSRAAATTEGVSWVRARTRWKRALSANRTVPLGDRYSMCAGRKWKMWEIELDRVTGMHLVVRQRSFHVQVICRRRPLLVRTTVGGPAGRYGAKCTATCTFDGATHFRSARTATRAVITVAN